MTTQALTPTANHLISLPLGELYQLGKTLLPTGFLPSTIKTAEQAVAIMLKGQELRIPPMYALSNIVVIQGKPAANAELMLALIYRDHGDDAIIFTETAATGATISYKRRSWKQRQTFTFTAADAKTAGLTGGNWSKYPAAMLRARCISAVARLAFPDTIGGMYTPEELGADTNVETGEIFDQPTYGAALATTKQVAYIGSLQDDNGWHSEYMAEFAAEHGITDLTAITRDQASVLIEAMKEELERPYEPKQIAAKPGQVEDTPLPPITQAEQVAAKNGERLLVKRLREIVADCRQVGVPVPSLPKPKEITDEALIEAIDELEFAYKLARKAAEQALDEPVEEPAL
jgi:hypothetical protein